MADGDVRVWIEQESVRIKAVRRFGEMRFIVIGPVLSMLVGCIVIAGARAAPQEQDRVNDDSQSLIQEKTMSGAITSSSQDIDEVAKSQKIIQQNLVATLASLVPTEFDAYRNAILQKNEVDVAHSVIGMVSKIRELADRPPQRRRVLLANRTAWELCIKQFKTLKSEEARKLILAEWCRSLTDEEGELLPARACVDSCVDGDRVDAKTNTPILYDTEIGTVPLQQLDALGCEFDRAFLNAEFWKLVRQSKKGETMSGICCILYEHGNQQDLGRLQDRLNTMSFDDPRRNMVRSAIDCITWRLDGKPRGLGPIPNFHFPAQQPPRTEPASR